MLDYIAFLVGAILILLGIAGSVLPILPGPPLSFIGLFLFALVRNFSYPLTPKLMIILLLITIIVTVIDYLLPLIGAKKYGTSKWGIYGSVVGMILGAFFSPFGIIIGAFIGAVLVEWFVSKKKETCVEIRLGNYRWYIYWNGLEISNLSSNGLLFD